MDALSATIDILGLVISVLGVYYTWKTLANTDTIKESVTKEVRRDRFYTESPVLLDKIKYCEFEALKSNNPLENKQFEPSDQFFAELYYICDRLVELLKGDVDGVKKANEIMTDFKHLQHVPSNHPQLSRKYCILIQRIKSLLMTGRS